MSCQQPTESPQPPNAAAKADGQALAQALAEAWAVVHFAEQHGHRDISDALHQAIAHCAHGAASPADDADSLDDAREHALARLDACGALADDATDLQ